MRTVWLWGMVTALMFGLLSLMPTATAARSVHLVASGDFGAQTATRTVLDGMGTAPPTVPDAVLALGDLKYKDLATEEDWCAYVRQSIPVTLPFELVAGNHDVYANASDGAINKFAACLPNGVPGLQGTYGREYYLDFPQTTPLVRVIMVSPSLVFENGVWAYKAGDAHYQWLSNAIDNGRLAGAKWIVVGMHYPCWTIGVHPCHVDQNLSTDTDAYKLLIEKKVDLVLAGHEHAYMRTHQLASGSATCQTVPVASFNASCIADTDNSFQAGSGTVFATVGTGGVPLRAINPTGTHAGYFGSTMGSNQKASYGYLDLQIGETTLGAKFVTTKVVATGGTAFTDSFTINEGTGTPVNQLPVASFTSTPTGLKTNVNAAASWDPDGTVASYSWNWGDSTAASSGVTATHTYAKAGTYTVTLKVTDNAGGTGTTTKQVAVTTAAGALVSDTFTRTTTSGFGSAPLPTPMAYTVLGTASNYSVNGSTGRIKIVAGSSRRAYLPSVSAPASDTSATFSFEGLLSGKGFNVAVMPKVRPDTSSYRARVTVDGTGTATLGLYRSTSTGAETGFAYAPSATAIKGITVNSKINVRTQVTGSSPTTVRAKMWLAGTTEPTSWQVSSTDSTAGLQGNGSVGVSAYESSTATSALTFIVDDLNAKTP